MHSKNAGGGKEEHEERQILRTEGFRAEDLASSPHFFPTSANSFPAITAKLSTLRGPMLSDIRLEQGECGLRTWGIRSSARGYVPTITVQRLLETMRDAERPFRDPPA